MDVQLLCLLALFSNVLLFLFRVNLIIANKWHIYMPNLHIIRQKKTHMLFSESYFNCSIDVEVKAYNDFVKA